jgi:sugar lactone lactonase YvrE
VFEHACQMRLEGIVASVRACGTRVAELTVIANSSQGRRLNRPNDVVVKSGGAIYFTDPWSSPAAAVGPDVSGVYRLTPDLGT